MSVFCCNQIFQMHFLLALHNFKKKLKCNRVQVHLSWCKKTAVCNSIWRMKIFPWFLLPLWFLLIQLRAETRNQLAEERTCTDAGSLKKYEFEKKKTQTDKALCTAGFATASTGTCKLALIRLKRETGMIQTLMWQNWLLSLYYQHNSFGLC